MWNKPQLLNTIADLLMLAASAALLAGVAIWLVRVPALPVDQVVFAEPLAHTRRLEVEQALPAALKGNFFSLNLETVRGALEKLLRMALKYPGMRGAILRKTAASLGNTALATWTTHVAAEAIAAHLCWWYGGSVQHAAGYVFANGSFIAVGGLDNPDKIMSSEFDVVYINGDHNIPTVLTQTAEEGGATRVLKLRQI